MQHWAKQPTWFAIQVTQSILESTNGKDKVLKLMQYSLRFFVELYQIGLRREVIPSTSTSKPTIPLSAQSAASLADGMVFIGTVARQISVGRKLFRFGRSIHCILQIRQLFEERNSFIQVIGIHSWFWNALWFICDHTQWLSDIGAIKSDPTVGLNKLSSVLMQVFQFLYLSRLFAQLYWEEQALEQELLKAKSESKQIGRRKSAEDLRALQDSKIATVDDLRKMLAEPIDPVERINKKLLTIRAKKYQMIPLFIKNLGDAIICWDFGFSWGLPPVWTSLSGVAAGVAGFYQEVQAANEKTLSKIEKSGKESNTKDPPKPAAKN